MCFAVQFHDICWVNMLSVHGLSDIVSPVLINGDFESPTLTDTTGLLSFIASTSLGDGWFVVATSCSSETSKCQLYLERNIPFSPLDVFGRSPCDIYMNSFPELMQSNCKQTYSRKSLSHYSGFHSVVIPPGMGISTRISRLVSGAGASSRTSTPALTCEGKLSVSWGRCLYLYAGNFCSW